jgi:hypothetical protein
MRWGLAVATLWVLGGVVGGVVGGCVTHAQNATPSPLPLTHEHGSSDGTYTLHVYTNLVQIPTLILNIDFDLPHPVPIEKIDISLDRGPNFHPVKMHMEGHEPVSLSMLIDVRYDLLHRLPEKYLAQMIGSFAKHSLGPEDSLTLYAVHCRMASSQPLIHPTEEAVETAVRGLLLQRGLHGDTPGQPCNELPDLWSATAHVAQQMTGTSGHRALLLVSSGKNLGGPSEAEVVRELALYNNIAIFSVHSIGNYIADIGFQSEIAAHPIIISTLPKGGPDPFFEMSASTGGLAIASMDMYLEGCFERVMTMMRGRYILEFPRPDKDEPGMHSIDVTVPSSKLYIVTAGVSYPNESPEQRNAPNTIAPKDSPAVFGDQRPKKP